MIWVQCAATAGVIVLAGVRLASTATCSEKRAGSAETGSVWSSSRPPPACRNCSPGSEPPRSRHSPTSRPATCSAGVQLLPRQISTMRPLASITAVASVWSSRMPLRSTWIENADVRRANSVGRPRDELPACGVRADGVGVVGEHARRVERRKRVFLLQPPWGCGSLPLPPSARRRLTHRGPSPRSLPPATIPPSLSTRSARDRPPPMSPGPPGRPPETCSNSTAGEADVAAAAGGRAGCAFRSKGDRSPAAGLRVCLIRRHSSVAECPRHAPSSRWHPERRALALMTFRAQRRRAAPPGSSV
jgi:hypothetical protein